MFVGCQRWRETPVKHQVSHSAPMNGQWLSINLASQLVSQPEPTTMSISKQFDPSSWLIHQHDLICNPDRFPEGKRVEFKEEVCCKILNLRQPLTNNAKCCLEHSRWVMVLMSGLWWLIYFVDGLFISHVFEEVSSSDAAAQSCTSPSASWPRRVMRT